LGRGAAPDGAAPEGARRRRRRQPAPLLEGLSCPPAPASGRDAGVPEGVQSRQCP
jgi:hypothetical protein